MLFHSPEDDLERMEEIVEDRHFPLFPLCRREALRVYQAHLFQNSRLAGLSSSYHDDQYIQCNDPLVRTMFAILPRSNSFTSFAIFF